MLSSETDSLTTLQLFSASRLSSVWCIRLIFGFQIDPLRAIISAVFFRTLGDYSIHCLKHRIEVGALDCPDYELRALDFLTKPPFPSLRECTRLKGDVVRYDSLTDEFAVFSFDGFIRTYMRVNVSVHGLPTNMDYFRRECGRH
jgi:hypothetical protein